MPYAHINYDDDWCGSVESDKGANDEYYNAYCPGCGEVTEHDGCTGECCEC
jgi:hypothetical protein